MKQTEITPKQQQSELNNSNNKQTTDDSGKAVVNTSEAYFIQKVIKETRKDFIYEQSLVDCALIFSKLRAFQQVYSAKGLASIAQFLKKCSIIEISQANKVFYERERRSDECSAFLLLRGAIKIEEFAPSIPLDKSKISTQPGNDDNKEINNAQQVLIKKSKILKQNTLHSKNESSKEKDQTEKQPSNENKESISAEQNVFTINEMELFGQRKREGRPSLQKCIALSEQCILLSFELSSLESLFSIDEVAVSTVREKKNILNDLPLFSQCSFKQITSLSLMATTFTLLKGEKLFSQDDFSKGFFYLLKGELEVVLDSGTASSQLKIREASLTESDLLRKNSGKSRLLNQYSEQHCKQVGILTACDVVGLEDLVLERPRPVRIQVLSYEATLLYFPLQSFEIQTFLNDQTKSNIASTAASQVAWRQTRAKINSNTLTKCQFYNAFVQSPNISKRNDYSSFDAQNSTSSRRKTEQSFFETPSKDKKHPRHSPICSSKEQNQNSPYKESFQQYSPLNRTSYQHCNTPKETRKRNNSGEVLKFEKLKDPNRNVINSSVSNKKEQNNLQDAIRKEQPGSLKDRRNGWFNMNDSFTQQKISSFVDFPEGSSLQQIPFLNESSDILNLRSNTQKRQFTQSKNSTSPISDFISKTQGSQRKKSSKPNKITLPVFRLEKILKERENNGQEQKVLEINDAQILNNKHSPNNHPNNSQEEKNNNSFNGQFSHINTFSGEENELKIKNNTSVVIEKDSVSICSPNQQKSGLQTQKDNPEDNRSQSDNTKNEKESSKGDKEALRNVTQQSEEENRIIEADETIRQKLEIKKRVLERFAEIPKGENNDNQERYIYPRNLFDRKKDLNIRIQLEKCRLEEQQRSTSLYLHNTRYEHSGFASFILFEDYRNRKIRYFKRDKNLLGIADTSQGKSQTNGSALIPPLVVERSAAVKNNKRKLKNSRNTEYGNFINKQTLPRQNKSPFRWQE